MNLLSLLGLGFLLGLRHATDADHVVAVSTIVSRERRLGPACLLGAVWGLGHTATVFLVGLAIVALKLVIPARVGLSFEFAVGLMLILLGGLNLDGRAAAPAHDHPHAARTPGRLQVWRSLSVGLVHGLAGSAAVALLVLTAVTDPRDAAVYLLVFGLGTFAGMIALSLAMEASMLFMVTRDLAFSRALTVSTGALSVAFGVWIVYRTGFVDGLFLAAPVWIPR